MSWPPFKVVLDTNVLFPPLLRDVLLRAAEKGLYQPYWSAQILDELQRTLVRVGNLSENGAQDLCATIQAAFPEAKVAGFEHLIAVMPNHEKDRHVAAAATLIGAQVIVTSNLVDFGGLQEGLDPQAPDLFLMHLFDLAPDQMASIVEEIVLDYERPPQSIAELLVRLERLAPTFRAALAAYIATDN